MSNNIATKAKLIERIRNLLAMGGDISSPNEAAIALKRARKLMDEHQVTMSDIEALRESDMGESGFEGNSGRQETWISSMALSVAALNDCIVRLNNTIAKSRTVIVYEFCGFKEDAQMCEFMLAYLVDTARRSYERDRKPLKLSGIADKNDYLLGFAEEINTRIKTMIEERKEQLSEECKSRSLIVSKQAMVQKEYGKTRKGKATYKRSRSQSAYRGGKSAAKKVHLGNFVGSSNAATGSITC